MNADRCDPSFFSGMVFMETEFGIFWGVAALLTATLPPVCGLASCSRGPGPHVIAALLDAPFDFAALFLVVFFVSSVLVVDAPLSTWPSPAWTQP